VGFRANKRVAPELCLRRPATAVRRGAVVFLALVSAAAGFVSGPVGDALQQGLRELGYSEARNLVWDVRSTDGGLDQLVGQEQGAG
jgi:hypothetical protein